MLLITRKRGREKGKGKKAKGKREQTVNLEIWVTGGGLSGQQEIRPCGYNLFEKTKPISQARRDGEQGKSQKLKGKRESGREPRTAGDSYPVLKKQSQFAKSKNGNRPVTGGLVPYCCAARVFSGKSSPMNLLFGALIYFCVEIHSNRGCY